MANNQNEYPIPTTLEDQTKRQTARHLPAFFRTDKNKKFLGGTLDHLTQPGKLTRVNAYIGRRDIPNYNTTTDNYIEETSMPRQYYQLETSYSYQDPLTKEVFWYADYIDYINSLKYFGAPVANHSRLNKQEAYTWDPHIDWDKFVNFREYYWVPGGPDPITIYGELESVVSTYSITLQAQGNNSTFLFNYNTAQAAVSNPRLTLYRGMTYKFVINIPGKQFSIKTEAVTGDSYFYNIGVNQQKISQGTMTFTVPLESPDLLYYLDNLDLNTLGIFDIKDKIEASSLDVEAEILGKKSYKSSAGIEFINGLKLKFSGQVTPAKYAKGFWYIEGVGTSIKLINYEDLISPAIYGDDRDEPFDEQPFDSVPWDTAQNYPKDKDYIVINRASKDRNTWSRNNRWFNRAVLETTAAANNYPYTIDQTQRAKRPIIEFEPDLKLFQYGWIVKADIDFVDTVTTDVFSTVEGSSSYYIDGKNSIYPGHRVMFLADTDSLVYGKVFIVENIFNANENKTQITLQEATDSVPVEGEVFYVKSGDSNAGFSYYYQNGVWNLAQKKTSVNQAPLFDLFDENMVSFSDATVYSHNSFSGNRLFGYKKGTGANDTELGFSLSYLNIDNVGDIEFEFDLETKNWTYQKDGNVTTVTSDSGFLRRYNNNSTFSYLNGWVRTFRDLDQSVVRVIEINATTDLIAIDVYDNSARLTDLKIRVYVNNVKVSSSKLSLQIIGNLAYIKFNYKLSAGDVLVYKVRSLANKNLKGYYEIPLNWQNNPLNDAISTFTFGEAIDHVKSMIEDITTFDGSFPGQSNLSTLGYITPAGKRFLQHAGSMALSSFLMTDKTANIVRSLRWTARKYSDFKKEFLKIAQSKHYDGTVSEIVDQILLEFSRAKYVDTSAFHFSDMAPYGAASVRQYTVEDIRLPVFVIDSIFDPMSQTRRSILVYRNDVQLIYGIDYTFETTDAFVIIRSELAIGDSITIKDYASTNGCYIPFTPSALGLYPSYVPRIYLDDTYLTPIPVIQGHDGSIIAAYNDYRDDLILDLEKRIFNTRRVEYDISIFNIDSVIGSYYYRGDYTKTEIEDVLLVDFLNWNSIPDVDFTSNNYYVPEQSFTYNYGRSMAPNGNDSLPGYWRGVYKYFYDTDRPHTHPWEMQGFSIKPEWWDTVYGSAPYTSENKILWDSIENGIIRDPANRRTIVRYKRPGMRDYLPVDSEGNLISPLDSRLAQSFSLVNGKGTYIFGDHAPVETAWRRSSEYPFAVIVAMCVLRGADFIGKMWDRFTIKRNIANQIYYTATGNRLQLADLVFSDVAIGNTNDPNVARTHTSGLANIVEEYIFMQKYINIDTYKTYIKGLDAKLAYKIGGFTSKDKINVLLDSRSPTASGNIFLPQENYSVFFNKSFPVSSISYSGVLIERLGSDYPQWKSNVSYKKGDRIIFQTVVYRCVIEHVSSNQSREYFVEKYPDQNIPTDLSSLRFQSDNKNWVKEDIYRSGFKIKGYDNSRNYFEVYPPMQSQNDFSFNVGGVSESFVDWAANPSASTVNNSKGQSPDPTSGTGSTRYYIKNQIVRYNDRFYRAIVGHSSSSNFEADIDKWQLLSKLPLTGGVTALNRTRFEETLARIPYGTIFANIQTVIDFLLGYQKRLTELGFSFDDFSSDLSVPLDWLTSAKEFMFWTLQNWDSGSVITLSPSATKLRYNSITNTAVDSFVSDLHDYSIFKADGTPLKSNFTDMYRDNSGFTVTPSAGSTDGIFFIRADLVYKEHVLLLDNRSVFNDVIYDQVPGYRQGRVKLVGFKTSGWDGDLTSPGFVYDEAKITDWQPNTDYGIGDVVRHKNYYFTAGSKINAKSDFVLEDWIQLKNPPKQGLIPNFDYKVEQFRDFYNLDASIYDSNQQTLARHLIGYQPRSYLNDVIIDDVAQYKFYQGFIKEKGTMNSVTKLFDALRASGFSSVDIKEEWAFKLGDYGASDAYTEIEIPLKEHAIRYNPQDVVLSQQALNLDDLSIFNVTPDMVSIKPSSYDSKPFNLVKIDQKQNDYGVFKYPVAGYVRPIDVNFIMFNEASLMNYNVTQFREGQKFWLGYTANNDWDVLEFVNLKTTITTWTIQGNIISLECSQSPDVKVNDIVTIKNLDSVTGSYKVQGVTGNIVKIFTFNTALYHLQSDSTHGLLYKFTSVRYSNFQDIVAKFYDRPKIRGEKLWVDSDANGSWVVLQNQDAFTKSTLPTVLDTDGQQFGSYVKISGDKRWMFVAAIATDQVAVYYRPNNMSTWNFVQDIPMPTGYTLNVDKTERFGTSIDVSKDGSLLVVSAPYTNNVRGNYRGPFSTLAIYAVGDIVQYNGKLYRAILPVVGDGSTSINPNSWDEDINQASAVGSETKLSISTVSRNSNIATIFMSCPHNLSRGDVVSVQGVSDSSFNVTNVIVTDIPTTTSFKFANTGSDVITPKSALTAVVYVPRFNQGAVFTFRYDTLNGAYKLETVIASHDPLPNERFGSKIKLTSDGSNTWLFVSSKDYDNGNGRVQVFKNNLKTPYAYTTSDIDNTVSLSTTIGLEVGMPVYFYGTEFGGLNDTQKYYIHTIVDGYKIKIKTSKFGSPITLTTATGKMLVNAGGWTYSKQRFLNLSNIYSNNIAPANSYVGKLWYSPANTQYYYYNGTSWTASPLSLTGQYGYDLDTNSDASVVVVSAPFTDEGSVYVFNRVTDATLNYDFQMVTVINATTITEIPNLVGSTSYLAKTDTFGYAVSVTDDMLFVSAPNNDADGKNVGAVYYFDIVNSTYRLRETVFPPITLDSERFGLRIKLNPAETVLTVSSGGNSVLDTTFDRHSLRLAFTDDSTRSYVLDTTSKTRNPTTFDASSTIFYDITAYTGAVYVYNRFDKDFIYGDRLLPIDTLATDDNFGSSIDISDDSIMVGTPNRYVSNYKYGTVYIFDYNQLSWNVIASENSVVDVTKFKKAFLYNTETNTLLRDLDFYDPAKGLIPKIAQEEITYQTFYDPAVYQYTALTNTAIDQSNFWTDEHVGEVWWDISKLKYTWYEQGDATYRNNNWGALFPGSTVDIYEWVASPYLPSKWAMMADTTAGLAMGISGIPREIDDFTYSSNYKYDPVSNSTIMTYYFWVKGKRVTPNIPSRNINCSDLTKLILDPKSQGLKYVSITGQNSLSLTSINKEVKNNVSSLNLQFYNIENTDLLVHRQYSLIADQDPTAIISSSIENKWFDSLVGLDIKNRRVPDPNLSKRQRYGNQNSPRQSWFVNRLEALKQLFEYVNSVLSKIQIPDDMNMTNLMKSDPEPSLITGEIDVSVTTLEELRFIGMNNFKRAKLSASVIDGRLKNIFIDDAGFGYGTNRVYEHDINGNPIKWYGPTVSINGTGEGAQLQTVVNSNGSIISVILVYSGIDYDQDTLRLTVRDFTVLVQTDSEANNGWSLQNWNSTKLSWYRIKTQSYNVERYWKYKDWYSEGVSVSSDVNYLIDSVYELGQVSANIGEVVKINNAGKGTWLLLERTAITNSADYTNDYMVIGKENATIEFSDSLYNLNQDLGYDVVYGYDASLYDQNPTVELRIILESLRDDILINDLRIEYIKTFFNSVHYVLSEQAFADWVFKTSFLKVNHNLGSLKQRITFQDDVLSSYEEFIQEAKPYKSKVREWVSSYQGTDESYTVMTDFDLQSFYNADTGRIETVDINSFKIASSPWNNWLNNHTFELTDIVIDVAGKNYTTPPKVIISGGFLDTHFNSILSQTSIDMNSSVGFVQLARRLDMLSTHWPMSVSSPGIYAVFIISNGTITVQAAGLPYHSYGNPAAVNIPTIQDYNVTLPLRAGTNDPSTILYPISNGIIGYWLNGVAMFSPSAATGSPQGFPTVPAGFNYNAAFESGQELGYNFGEDLAGGHAAPGGIYHYHDFSFQSAWLSGTGAITDSPAASGVADAFQISYLNGYFTHPDGHSKILGWSIDGYPVYGPYGYDNPKDNTSVVRYMKTGYQLKNINYRRGTNANDIITYPMGIFIQDYEFVGSGDLDTHNGRYCITPDYPNGTYAYFVTVDEKATASSLDLVPVYPYVIGNSFYGIPQQDFANVVPGKGIAPISIPVVSPAVSSSVNGERVATATAYLSNGSVYSIVIDDPGHGYVTAPTIYLSGGTKSDSDRATAYAVIGNTKSRTFDLEIKYDRITFDYAVSNFRYIDTFSGTGIQTEFKLTYAPQPDKVKITIMVDNIEIYGSLYDVVIREIVHDTYTALEGSIVFHTAPAYGIDNITISYDKNINLYSAADRINYAYNPISGQIGKDLGQLITGIDYGGVAITSIDFDVSGGWDVIPWDAASWDNVLDTNNDVAFIASDPIPNVKAHQLVIGRKYKIQTVGNTLWSALGVTVTPAVNVEFIATATAPTPISAGDIASEGSAYDMMRTFVLPYTPEDQEVINVYIDRREMVSTTIIQTLPVNSLVIPVDSILGIMPGDTIRIPYYVQNNIIFSSRVMAVNSDPTRQNVVITEPILYTVPSNSIIEFSRIVSVRIDDPHYDQSTMLPNKNAEMLSFVGDGNTNTITLPDTVNLISGEAITFRRSTSDGTILPTDRSLLDSFLTGGDLAYSTARGITADEIVVDGDGLITADTSHGPEELVQGQVVDTLDISVYHAPTAGGPNVHIQNYVSDGVNTTFSLGYLPGTLDGLTVVVDNKFVKFKTDFSKKTITLTETPALDSKIVLISIDTAGYDVLDIEDFIGDGSTTEFLTAVRYGSGNFTIFATVNGIVSSTTIKSSDDTYQSVGNIVVQIPIAPAAGSIVKIMVFSGSVIKYSQITSQYFDLTTAQSVFTLNNPPKNIGPLSSMVLVVADNEFLRAPDYNFHVYDGTTISISEVKYTLNSLKNSDISVYKNGLLMNSGTDYSLDSSKNTVYIYPGFAAAGDEITVEIFKNNDFLVQGDKLIFQPRYNVVGKSKLKVTTFTNHDIDKIRRNDDIFYFDVGYDNISYDSVIYDTITSAINNSGIFDIPRTISDTSGLFVSFDRKFLTPNVDYKVLENKRQIRVLIPDILGQVDYLEIITTNDKTIKPSYGFKMFKDMLNRYHYKVLDKATTTTLASDLRYFDTRIELVDASALENPVLSKLPGVIEIDGERIEYYAKDGNFLRQIRRGTLGTGTKQIVKAGTRVIEMGQRNTVPYADNEHKKTFYSDGVTDIYSIDIVPQISIQTAGIFVVGRTYKIVSQGSSGNPTDFTKIGAADNNVGTLFTATDVGSGTGTASLNFDSTYGQCDSIEVFVAGRRLRKMPIQVYDQSLGQDSYDGVGDKWIPAEFSVNGTDNSVKLAFIPPAGELITIIYKQGNIWYRPGETVPLRFSDTDVARFVTARAVDLPK
jgi:YHYH protein/FG-GAP repeat